MDNEQTIKASKTAQKAIIKPELVRTSETIEKTIEKTIETVPIAEIDVSTGELRTRQRKSLMIKALKKTSGHISKACEAIGINRITHQRWMNADRKYALQVSEIQGKRLDNAQLVVDSISVQVKENPALALKASMFLLEQLGGSLGYQKPGVAVQVNNNPGFVFKIITDDKNAGKLKPPRDNLEADKETDGSMGNPE